MDGPDNPVLRRFAVPTNRGGFVKDHAALRTSLAARLASKVRLSPVGPQMVAVVIMATISFFHGSAFGAGQFRGGYSPSISHEPTRARPEDATAGVTISPEVATPLPTACFT
jgi:hypothetical protein